MLITEHDPAITNLRRRLDEFYAKTTSYDAFQTPPSYTGPWSLVRDVVEDYLRTHEHCRVLEFGAGLSNFGLHVKDLRGRLDLSAQDVTDRNRAFLLERVNDFHAGTLLDLRGPYDVIFSTYVWEHVSDPQRTLAHLLNILSPEGSLILFCPRYDMPGYFPPSARHLPFIQRLALGTRLALRRVAVALGAKPAFIIHSEPAVLSVPWYRDADAIHWVSYWDLKRALPRGYTIERIGENGQGFKRRVLDRALKLCVRITKPALGTADGDRAA